MHYAGAAWNISALAPPFADLVRSDDDGDYQARVMAANLAANVGGGFTWQEKRDTTPVVGDLESFQRDARAVEAEARRLFAASALAANEGWTTITEQEREKFRICARASLRTA